MTPSSTVSEWMNKEKKNNDEWKELLMIEYHPEEKKRRIKITRIEWKWMSFPYSAIRGDSFKNIHNSRWLDDSFSNAYRGFINWTDNFQTVSFFFWLKQLLISTRISICVIFFSLPLFYCDHNNNIMVVVILQKKISLKSNVIHCESGGGGGGGFFFSTTKHRDSRKENYYYYYYRLA